MLSTNKCLLIVLEVFLFWKNKTISEVSSSVLNWILNFLPFLSVWLSAAGSRPVTTSVNQPDTTTAPEAWGVSQFSDIVISLAVLDTEVI